MVETIQNPSGSEAVCVAVHCRPLIASEREKGCCECLSVVPGQPQIGHGTSIFTYDQVFGGNGGQDPALLYDTTVAPLVDSLFKGMNATVFAYGQTGSGKTYTMGSAFPQDPSARYKGVIPRVMDNIFSRIAQIQDVDFTVQVGFVEIHKEDIRDLLSHRHVSGSVHIREMPSGDIVLAGATEREVKSANEMAMVLEQGTALRATAETGMNKHSSRSHAIFTITLEQRKRPPTGGCIPRATRGCLHSGESSSESDPDEEGEGDDVEDDDVDADEYLCAKMHLVDLAGSERAKRTKATGHRLKEGININQGLLALGNVINALSEGKSHIPYRNSKLTRMLQSSLGGNSRTLMISCVSPADNNLEESLNTLRYASRARAIKNKPVVNRDPVAAQLASLRQQLATAKSENMELRRRLGMTPTNELDDLTGGSLGGEAISQALEHVQGRAAELQRELAMAHAENAALHAELKSVTEAHLIAQMQRDKMAQALTAVAGQKATKEAMDAMKFPAGQETAEGALAARVEELQQEVIQLRALAATATASAPPAPLALHGGGIADFAGTSLNAHIPPSPLTPTSPATAAISPGSLLSPQCSTDGSSGGSQAEPMPEPTPMTIATTIEEHAHHSEIARVQSEIDVLQRQLENKEAAMAAVACHAAVKASYESALREVAEERDSLARERADLLTKLRALQAATVEERMRLEKMYKERLREVETKAKETKKKEARIMELEATRKRALATVKALEKDISSIKSQKNALQRKAERAAKDFAAWKMDREREMHALRRQGRANEMQLQRMEAMHAKQQEVLRRKLEEAKLARARLQRIQEGRQRRHADRRSPQAAGNGVSLSSNASQTPPHAAGTSTDANACDSHHRNVVDGAHAPSSNNHLQPNPSAPVLVDESAQRRWIETELDACCSSYELQKVLECEKALRSEAARQLREVERRLAALRNPAWWGPPTASDRHRGAGRQGASAMDEDALSKKRARLVQAAERHGQQIQDLQVMLMQARAEEEERGAGAADANRWATVPAAPEVRQLLCSVFRAASQYKAQAYETNLAVNELSEELEMLRLRLEVVEAEKLEAAARADAAAQAATKAQVSAAAAVSAAASQSRDALGDANDAQAADVLRKLDSLSQATRGSDGQEKKDSNRDGRSTNIDTSNDNNDGQRVLHATMGGSEYVSGSTDSTRPRSIASDDRLDHQATQGSEGSAAYGAHGDDEEDSDYISSSSSEEEEEEDEADVWDPTKATPEKVDGVRAARKQQQRQTTSVNSKGSRDSSEKSSVALPPQEQKVLDHLNTLRASMGKETLQRPTVPALRAALKGRILAGQEWRAGGKKRQQLVQDYLAWMVQEKENQTRTSSAGVAVPASAQGHADRMHQFRPPSLSRGNEGGKGNGSANGHSRGIEHEAGHAENTPGEASGLTLPTTTPSPGSSISGTAAIASGSVLPTPRPSCEATPLPRQHHASSIDEDIGGGGSGPHGAPQAGGMQLGSSARIVEDEDALVFDVQSSNATTMHLSHSPPPARRASAVVLASRPRSAGVTKSVGRNWHMTSGGANVRHQMNFKTCPGNVLPRFGFSC